VLEVAITQIPLKIALLWGWRRRQNGWSTHLSTRSCELPQELALTGCLSKSCPSSQIEALWSSLQRLFDDDGVKGLEPQQLFAIAGDCIGRRHEGLRIEVRITLPSPSREFMFTIFQASVHVLDCLARGEPRGVAREYRGITAGPSSRTRR